MDGVQNNQRQGLGDRGLQDERQPQRKKDRKDNRVGYKLRRPINKYAQVGQVNQFLVEGSQD